MNEYHVPVDGSVHDANEAEDYLSYLLRLWRTSRQGTAWHASLESAQTGEQRRFACLDDLVDYLRQVTRETTATGR